MFNRERKFRFKYNETWTQWYDDGKEPDLRGMRIQAIEVIEKITADEYKRLNKGNI